MPTTATTGRPLAGGDVVGCGIDYHAGRLFYTLNGKYLGYFGRKRCYHQERCRNLHVQGSFECNLGPYDPSADTLVRSDSIVYKSGLYDGCEWYTAGYRCPQTKIFYLAEGIGGVRLSSTGVYWYTSREEARRALVAVLATARRYGSR